MLCNGLFLRVLRKLGNVVRDSFVSDEYVCCSDVFLRLLSLCILLSVIQRREAKAQRPARIWQQNNH